MAGNMTEWAPGKYRLRYKGQSKNISAKSPREAQKKFAILEEYKKDQQQKGFLCGENNNLFIRYDGKPKFTYWLSAWFPKFLKKYGLPHLNFHGTRHSSASFLLNSGASINAVADRLGDTPTTLLNIYSHALRNSDREAADTLDSLHKMTK